MIQIVFENEDFVVCDKPSGVLTTPARPHESDQRLCLGTNLQTHLNQQIYPVHRLDFEVSGLVLFAKNSKSHALANSWFEEKLIQKTYCALTGLQDYSHIPSNVVNARLKLDPILKHTYVWQSKLLRGKKRAYENATGKDSKTLAELREVRNTVLCWDLMPVTGRPHQLRYELSRHGFPIIGDSLYGSHVEYGENRIALRSYKLDFRKCTRAITLKLPEILEVSSL